MSWIWREQLRWRRRWSWWCNMRLWLNHPLEWVPLLALNIISLQSDFHLSYNEFYFDARELFLLYQRKCLQNVCFSDGIEMTRRYSWGLHVRDKTRNHTIYSLRGSFKSLKAFLKNPISMLKKRLWGEIKIALWVSNFTVKNWVIVGSWLKMNPNISAIERKTGCLMSGTGTELRIGILSQDFLSYFEPSRQSNLKHGPPDQWTWQKPISNNYL